MRAIFAATTERPGSAGSDLDERSGSAQDVDHVIDERARGRGRSSRAGKQAERDVRQAGDLRGGDELRALGRQPLRDRRNSDPQIDSGLQYVEIRALAYDFKFATRATQRGGGNLVIERTLRGRNQLHWTILRGLISRRRNPTHRQSPFGDRVFRASLRRQRERNVELV